MFFFSKLFFQIEMSLIKCLLRQPGLKLLKISDIKSSNIISNGLMLHRNYCSSTIKRLELFSDDGGLLVAPENVDYFTMFGIKKSFKLDTVKLAKGEIE